MSVESFIKKAVNITSQLCLSSYNYLSSGATVQTFFCAQIGEEKEPDVF